MNILLINIGLKGINDFKTKLDENIFLNLDVSIVRETLKQYGLHDNYLIDEEESKFQHVNRILMFKYERVIDSIKNIDENGTGYKLSMVIGGLIEC